MSTATSAVRRTVTRAASFRAWALAAAAAVTFTYLSILYHVVDVAGGAGGLSVFVVEVVGAVLLAALLSRVLSVHGAVVIGAVLLASGLATYLVLVPAVEVDVGRLLNDTFALLTGLSVLRMLKAGIWALGFAPGPLFVSWYFFFRRRYAAGTIVAGATLTFFILTGDADTVLGLVGALGAISVLGFGRLDREGGTPAQRNTVVTLLVAILVVTTSVSLVPGGEAQPLLPDRGGGTIEGSLINADDRIDVLGSISLTPEVRFTVSADEPRYWRVAAYDRYTGDGWVRTGRATRYQGRLPRPEGDDLRRIRQTFRAESSVTVMPAAWKPVRVTDGGDRALITDMGGLQPAGPISKGDSYTVVSLVSDPAPRELRAAGTDYPARIEERYLQLPESTPDAVGQFTANLTANADNPYDTAAVIEQWLERNRDYSLDVDRPNGDIAAGFLFDMEQGYCVYYATAMVTMLRSQGIPARFVVGYTTGQQVEDDQWVVRGYDSHAWVEVYFPGHGWVRFDPTPAGPRQAVEQTRLEEARAENETTVDTELSEETTYTPPGGDGISPTPVGNRSPGDIKAPVTDSPFQPGPSGIVTDTGGSGTGPGGGLPSRETMLYGFVLFIGAVTAAQRTGLFERGYREVWLRRAPTGTPRERVEGAFARAEYLLAKQHRPRRTGETPRAYVEQLRAAGADERVVRLYHLYERSQYAGEVTEADARTARRILDELVEERSPFGRR